MTAKNKIGIIGAGAAGIIAAIYASDIDNEVVLLEKNNKIGKKIYITGKGRCNITNASDPSEHIENCVRNQQFLYSALYSFQYGDIISLLNENGLDTKIERGNRVFPATDKASDVVNTFSKILSSKRIDIRLNQDVKRIEKNNDKFIVNTINNEYKFDKLIIATGGLSYPSTGSNGSINPIIKKLGHSFTDMYPVLTSFFTKEDVSNCAGLTLKNIKFKLKNIELFGDLLFTHKGISGPVILTMTSLIDNSIKFPIEANINLKPALEPDVLDRRLIREIEKSPSRNIGNMLKELLPLKLIESIIERTNLNKFDKASTINKSVRRKIVDNILDYKITINGITGFKDAVVTRGGINVKEINPHSMESKIVKNLYFAGEIIDVDSLTGGYNLQIAWSTGYLAGISAKKCDI